MGKVDLPYLKPETNSVGKVYWYYRRSRNGKRVRFPLPGEPGSPEFMAEYWRLRGIDETIPRARDMAKRTIRALALEYYASPAFKGLKASTKRTYRVSIDELVDDWGDFLVEEFRFRNVNKIIGDMAGRPGAANKMLKRLRQLFALARQMEWIAHDPCDGVKLYKLGEIHTWTDEEIQQFLERWDPGTRQRLAFMLQLYTGQRNVDVVTEPWPRGGKIRVTQEKTGRHLWIPLARELAAELERHPKEHAVILATAYGSQRSAGGYGNFMADAIDKAGLPARCVAHGLRKAAARHLAEAGCTAHEIMSITGHASLAEAERYTRAVEQEKMAERAIAKRDQAEHSENAKGTTDRE